MGRHGVSSLCRETPATLSLTQITIMMKLHFSFSLLILASLCTLMRSGLIPGTANASEPLAFLGNENGTLTGNGREAEALAYDPEGRPYNIITFNGQDWLGENLQYDIGEEDCWCIEGPPENCYKYSRLYNWEGAQKACKAMGYGWRLPTDTEWKRLASNYGGYYDIPTSKEVGNSLRAYSALTKGGRAGFSARRGGPRSHDYQTHTGGDYWSGTAHDEKYVWAYSFDRYRSSLQRYQSHKYFGLGCRCVRD